MSIGLLSFASAYLLAMIIPVPSQAAQFIWQLDNVVFDSGGTATGYFVYDGDTETVTEWTIRVEGGSPGFPSFTYAPTNTYISAVTDRYVRLTETNMVRVFQIIPTKSLTGEEVPLSPHSSEVLSEARRSIIGGALKRALTP